MKNSLFARNPSQHQGTIEFMSNLINTMVSEGTLTPYTADVMHAEINQYHCRNAQLSLEEFSTGISTHFSQALEKALLESSSSLKLF